MQNPFKQGAPGAGAVQKIVDGSAVSYTKEQELTSEQQANARANIEAVSTGELSAGLAEKLDADEVGVSVASLVGGKVPSSQLPSYVDDVEEYADFAAFPGTGETDKIYVALDVNKQYRWTGSTYIAFSGGAAFIKNTTALNATVPVVAFDDPYTGDANYDGVLLVKGTGAILTQIPDGTSTGGNKRGSRAVDLQVQRSSTSQVASGDNSVIIGGQNNTAAGALAVAGGYAAQANYSFTVAFGGYTPIAVYDYGTAVGGQSNRAHYYAAAVGGYNNYASQQGSGILAGQDNLTGGYFAGVLCGQNNTASGDRAVVLGGSYGTSAAVRSLVPPNSGFVTFSTTGTQEIGRDVGTSNFRSSETTNYGNYTGTGSNVSTCGTTIPVSRRTNKKGVALFSVRVVGTDYTDFFAEEFVVAVSASGAGTGALMAAKTVLMSQASAGAATWSCTPVVTTASGTDYFDVKVTGNGATNTNFSVRVERLSIES